MPTPAPFRERFQSPRQNRSGIVEPQARPYKLDANQQPEEMALWRALSTETTFYAKGSVEVQEDSPAEKWVFRIVTALAVAGIVWRLYHVLST